MSYSSEVIIDIPEIYWELEDISGTTTPVDSSGNGKVASIHGTPNPGFGQPSIYDGLGTSLGLDGTGGGNYIYRDYDADLDVGTGDFALEFLVISNNSASNYVEVISRDQGATGNGVIVYFNITTGGFRIWIGGTVLNTPKRISDGLPHWIIISREAGVVNVWVDGEIDGSSTMSGSINLNSPVRIGTVNGTYSTLDGEIQHVSWYNHSLSLARISVHGFELGYAVIVEDPNQAAFEYIYENIGFNVDNTQEDQEYIYENIGVTNPNTQEDQDYIYEEVVPKTMTSRIGIPI